MPRYVIPPRFTLPDRHAVQTDDDDLTTAYVPALSVLPAGEQKQTGTTKASRFRAGLAFIRFLLYSGIALVVGYVLWDLLAPWTIYRIVALIVLLIAWANCATRPARGQMLIGKIVKKHRALTMNTVAYLKAIKQEDLKP